MTDVRQLTFTVGYNINDNPIRRANSAVDSYESNVRQADRSSQRLGRTTTTVGNNMRTLGQRATRAARDSRTGFNQLNSTLKTIGGAMLGYFSFNAIKRGITSVITETAHLEESTNRFNVVFAELAPQAEEWAKTFAKSVGRGVNQTKEAIARNQGLLFGFGATRDQAFELSKAIQTLGVDLASYADLSDEEAINRMTSALLGNHLAVKSMEIGLNEATLAQEMHTLGLKGTFQELDELTKIQVRFSTMVTQSKVQIGDAERSYFTFTSQLKQLGDNYKNAIAQGSPLNDQLTDFMILINDNFDLVTKFIADGIDLAAKGLEVLGEAFIFANKYGEILIPVATGLAAAFGAFKVLTFLAPAFAFIGNAFVSIASIMGGTSTAIVGVGGGFTALLGPIGWTVLAIGAVVAAGVALYRNWDKVKEVGSAVVGHLRKQWAGFMEDWETMKVNAKLAFDDLMTMAKGFAIGIAKVFGGIFDLMFIAPINSAIKGLNMINFTVPDWVPEIGGNQMGFNIPLVPTMVIPQFATGTRSAPKGLGIINESPRGELVTFKGGERVRTAAEAGALTQKMISNTNTSSTVTNTSNNAKMPSINININGYNKDPKQLANELRQEFRKEIDKYFVNLALGRGVTVDA